MNFDKVNNIAGWLVFIIALTVYALTVEPTASFWDCGEFIAASYKLQIPHPPGAPLFLLVGRAFSLLAGDNLEQVAYWVNMVSVASSAFTILFLFWSIVMLGRKVLLKEGQEPKNGQQILLLGAGAVGALAFTFSDSFWFSAVEAEVYAMSSLFTALVFWCMLKWERVADEPGSDRWLILIAYLVGLSIGVHLLNLVSLPALGFIYYFKKYKNINKRGLFATFAISGIIVVGILELVIPGLPSLAGKFEIMFVNSFGLGFGSGVIFFSVLFLALLVGGMIYSIKKQNVLLNKIILGFIFVIIGYSSYGIIVIRSQYDPPIDENDPENVISFVSYLKREQYGSRPLFYGPYFTAQVTKQEKGAPVYMKKGDKYVIVDHKTETKFDPTHETIFPRAYSTRPDHVEAYMQELDLPNRSTKPTFGQNLQIFFKRQLYFFYWRYFMWNFSGRESDKQDATWLSPLDALDDLPESLANNQARNNFFFIPLILGIIGLVFQYKSHRRDFIVVGTLFFMTGIAIIIYLNQPPVEPRERDYTHVGSFYTFCIWIGFSVVAIADGLKKWLAKLQPRAVIASVLALLGPGIMAVQGWDDHDRSNRYHSVDSAKNLLNSCAKNAIIFTGGDNDTFPLWYVQEVEGFRTDVRVCNLSLLGTDWYIKQMKRQAYDSDPLPITLTFDNFMNGQNDYLPFVEKASVKGGINVHKFVQLIEKRHPSLRLPSQSGGYLSILPTKNMILVYDRNQIIENKVVPIEKLVPNIEPSVRWNIGKSNLYKSDLLMLDILSTNAAQGWKRPIYFSTTLAQSNYLNLKDHFMLEGLAFRLVPVKFNGASEGIVNNDICFQNLTQNMFWRGLDNPNIFHDENYRKFPLNARNSFVRLCRSLMAAGDTARALETANYCLEKMPHESIPYDLYTVPFISILHSLGQKQQALDIAKKMEDRAIPELEWYFANEPIIMQEVQLNVGILQRIYQELRRVGEKDEAARFEQYVNNYGMRYQQLTNQRGR